MTKTPAQINREIDEVVGKRGAIAKTGNYYYVVDRDGNRTLHGPYETSLDAELSGYFNKPVIDRDTVPVHVFFRRGVQEYDQDEIKSMVRDPKEWGFKSFKLSRRAPPMHASRRAFDSEFRQHLRDHDHERFESSRKHA